MHGRREIATCEDILWIVFMEAKGEVGRCIDLRELRLPTSVPGALFRAVMVCVDAGLLEYIGAGPRVCLTEVGLVHAQQIAPSQRPPQDPES